MPSMLARSTSKSRTRNWSILIYVILQVSHNWAKCYSPPTFGSFNGRPAKTLNDCFWDFARCTDQNEVVCCQNRFDMCCKYIMNSPTNEILFTTSKPTRRPITSTTTQNPCRHGNSLIQCVWRFNGCVQEKVKRKSNEATCYECFDQCKMIVMGMMPMMDNSVDEIPVPFMSVEQTTESLNSVQNILPMREERRPTLAQCLWGFFKCNNEDCHQTWNQCMNEAMMNP